MIRNLVGRLAAISMALLAGAAGAQNISDVPVSVRNNVAPNFMFMIDNSGSMVNVVPAAPYSATATYTFSCTAGQTIAAGTSVDLAIVNGSVPAIRYGNTNYLHTSVSNSGSRRCFANNATYPARLIFPVPNFLPALYSGHYLNWYFGNFDGPSTGWSTRKVVNTGAVQTRMEIARASATSMINGLPMPATTGASAPVRVGLSTYNANSNGALLLNGMADLTTSTRTAVVNQIAGLTPTGNTPLASTLADLGRYFSTGYNGNVNAVGVVNVAIDTFLRQSGTDTPTARNSCPTSAPSCTSANSARPIQQWCQRSYAFLMTDGRPNGDRSFNDNTHLRDYDRDCTGSGASACVSNGATGSWDRKTARTYEGLGSDYLDDVAKALFDVDLRPDLVAPTGRTKRPNNVLTYAIGFADLQVQNDPLLTNTARQGGGLFISAQDGPALTRAFQTVVADAFAKDASSAAVGVVNPQLTISNIAYASSYNSGTWDGDYEAFALDTTTALPSGTRLWSAGDLLDARTPANRIIASWNGSTGQAFTAANFAGTPTSLTAGVINWLRGDRSLEGSTLRTRQHLLGDIVNAEAVVASYGNVPIIYQAANDGMLHVFDGRADAAVATRGRELWAYVPRLVHGSLAGLASPNYAHKFILDGTPAAAQITGAGSMTRILVGGLGKGGAGYYALDISSYAAADEAAAAAKAKWEFKPANMGYSYGTPLIVRTAAGWRVVVASGYDNGSNLGGDGQGHVWVLDPVDGSVVQRIDTGVGTPTTPSGLAHLAALSNTTPDALTRYVYGGDLLGNVWRFDLDTFSATLVATLTDAAGNTQPVTTPPTVGPVSGASSKFFLYVGTGRYMSEDDVPGTATVNSWATQRQTMYGIVDDTTTSPSPPNLRGSNGNTCPTGGGDGALVCQTLGALATTPVTYSATTHPVSLASKRGWYVDLPLTNGRINTASALTTKGTLVFTANVPTNVACDPGGNSTFFALDAGTGGAVAKVLGGNQYYTAGVFIGYALASRPVPVDTTGGKRALIQMSDKSFANPVVPEASGSLASWKKVYWRQLK